MVDAEEHYLYAMLSEIEMLDQFKGKTGKEQFTIIKYAFDNAEYGQMRLSADSVTASPNLRFNFTACTTINRGRKYFSGVLTDGTMRRLDFSTIPEVEIGAPQPVFGQYDEKFDAQLKPYIENLAAASGEIKCPQATRLAEKMIETCRITAIMEQDRTYETLARTACVIAWRKALVLYIANGMQWEKAIEDFALWSLEYNLWCKMNFFGDDIKKEESSDTIRPRKRGPQGIISELPEQFTLDNVMTIMLQKDEHYTPQKCRKTINVWKSRGYIDEISKNVFTKRE